PRHRLPGPAGDQVEGRQGPVRRKGQRAGSGSLRSLKIGLGLPNADKSLHDGRLLVEIARRADALGFSPLGTVGRIAYPNFEALGTLGVAACASERTCQ